MTLCWSPISFSNALAGDVCKPYSEGMLWTTDVTVDRPQVQELLGMARAGTLSSHSIFDGSRTDLWRTSADVITVTCPADLVDPASTPNPVDTAPKVKTVGSVAEEHNVTVAQLINANGDLLGSMHADKRREELLQKAARERQAGQPPPPSATGVLQARAVNTVPSPVTSPRSGARQPLLSGRLGDLARKRSGEAAATLELAGAAVTKVARKAAGVAQRGFSIFSTCIGGTCSGAGPDPPAPRAPRAGAPKLKTPAEEMAELNVDGKTLLLRSFGIRNFVPMTQKILSTARAAVGLCVD